MNLVEQMAEAMAKVDIGPDEWEGLVSDTYRVMAQAALEALGLVICQTCGGKGRIYTEPNDPGYTCSDCRLGVVPSDKMIAPIKAAIERANYLGRQGQFYEDTKDARAALLEAFGGDE